MKWFTVVQILSIVISGIACTGILNVSFAAVVSIEEIVVTARKKEENLQEVPISVTAFSGDDLEKRSIPDLQEVSRYAPNLYFSAIGTASPDQSTIFIRGVGNADSSTTTDPGVGIYIDGVYYGRSQGGIMDIVDIESIEVLRGPQGTLFGKNTVGGAINIVSKAPTGDLSGKIKISLGNLERLDVGGSVDLPIVKNLLNARVSLASKNRDCLFNRRSDNGCYGDENSKSYRAFLRFTPAENFIADVIIDGTERDAHMLPSRNIRFNETGGLTGAFNALVANGVLPGPQLRNDIYPHNSDDPYVTEGNLPTDAKTDVFGIAGRLRWEIGNVTLHSITAYREIDSFAPETTDSSTADFAEVMSFHTSEQFSQELRVDGGNLFNDRLDYVLGFYYLNEDATTDEPILLFNEPLTHATFGFGPFRNATDQTIESIAGFSHFNFDLFEKVRLSGGVRYTHEKKDAVGARHAANVGDTTPIQDVPISSFNNYNFPVSKSWDEFSVKVSLDYTLNDDVLFYSSASKGFRSGGFNSRADNVALWNTPFNPEIVWTYELGVKSDLLDNRLRLNVTGFYTDYTDRQVTDLITTFNPITGQFQFLPTISNNGKAEVKGFELEAIGIVNDNFRIELNAGYTDIEFTDDISKANGDVETYTPKWTVAVAGEYSTAVGELGDLSMRLDYNYRDKVALNIQPTDITTQKAFGLLNARATFYSADGNWEVAAYGRNLTDKVYKFFAIDQFGGVGLTRATYSDPREYGITIKRKF